MNIVVKVGGSLSAYPQKLRGLCNKLSEISKKYKFLMVPGGGGFADVVRQLDEKFSLSCSISHRMAVLGMDQYGLLLSDLTPNSCTVSTLEEAKKVSTSGKLPIFLPSQFMLTEDPLENSWDVTSDSIAFYLAWLLQVNKVLLATDVDGVYACDPKQDPNVELIREMSASELLAMNKRTSVDKFLPKLLLKFPVDCYVVNGLFAKRVVAVIAGQAAVGTLIKSQS